MEKRARDTPAWIFQVWVSFILSFGALLVGIAYLPVDTWTRAFMGVGAVFTVASSFTLAKTVRDNHEAERLINRVKEAKTERLLREFEDEVA